VRFPAKNIHVLNKNEKCIRGTRFAADVASRHNVILLGDSLGDIGMSNGVQCDEIVRVGFLNDNIEVYPLMRGHWLRLLGPQA
jgi:5'-nucleotidase